MATRRPGSIPRLASSARSARNSGPISVVVENPEPEVFVQRPIPGDVVVGREGQRWPPGLGRPGGDPFDQAPPVAVALMFGRSLTCSMWANPSTSSTRTEPTG